MKALSNISRIQLRNETVIKLLDLYESKGKTFYYDDLFKKDLQAFLNKTLERDIEEISNLLKLGLTKARIKIATKDHFVPKNKNEQLLFNLKKVLKRVHNNINDFELLVNEAQELSKMIADNYEKINWTKIRNTEKGLLASNNNRFSREELEKLIALFNKVRKEKHYELTNLIANFYVDFVNMKIFDNQNDLVALLIMYVLIYRNFPIFRYVSFFQYFNFYSDRWNNALTQANYNWESKFPQTDNLAEVIYNVLIDAYKEVDEKAYEYMFEKDLNKSDSIENTILKFQKLFTKEDIRKVHPTVSDSTINRTLKRLRDENKIIALEAGRSSKWKVTNVNKNRFSDLTLFSEEE